MIDARDYYEIESLVTWLDVDPRADTNWLAWVTTRPYAFVPDLRKYTHQISPLDNARLISHANDLVDTTRGVPGYVGPIKHERMTAEQIRFATGISTERGKLRPVRLDKALGVVFACNCELERKGLPVVRPKIFLSAFNIAGMSKRFNELEKSKKEEVRRDLAREIGQSEGFVSEFLKGDKVTLDIVARAHEILLTYPAFSDAFSTSLSEAIETPSQRFTKAAQGEDFKVGRLESLPEPYARPGGGK